MSSVSKTGGALGKKKSTEGAKTKAEQEETKAIEKRPVPRADLEDDDQKDDGLDGEGRIARGKRAVSVPCR